MHSHTDTLNDLDESSATSKPCNGALNTCTSTTTRVIACKGIEREDGKWRFEWTELIA
jgi:hypothetical protein